MTRAPEHRVWAEIYLDRIAHNLGQIRNQIPDETQIMPVVKADAYGHGAVQVAQVCREEDASMFALANTEEARQLRAAGFEEPLLVLGEVVPAEIPDLVHHRVRPSLQSFDVAKQLDNEAREQQEPHPVHMAVDTGMSRLGVPAEDAHYFARMIRDFRWLELEGISTHLSSAYDPDGDSYTEGQLDTFREVIEEVRSAGIQPDLVHVANSGAVFSVPDTHFDLIRPGITMYGMSPGTLSEQDLGLQPALELRTKLVHVKEVPAGRPIGYGRSYRVSEDTPVGVLSVGYHDGYRYQLSNNADVLIQGRRCPVIGRVTMDYVMVDLRDVPDVETGEVVTLVGQDKTQRITFEELADRADTICYEMTCSIGDRVPRIYRSSVEEN